MRILRDAWAAARAERGLWGFGLISSAQAVMSFLFVMVLVTISASGMVLAQTLAMLETEAPADPSMDLLVSEYTILVSTFLERHGVVIALGVSLVVLAWLALGATEVASVGGLIHQTDAVAAGGRASFSAGMSRGWRVWWRTAALYAVMMLPTLVTLTIQLGAMTLPVAGAAGGSSAPVAGSMFALQAMQPMMSLVSLASVPLGVVVAFGMRFGIIDDLEWRPALAASWGLVRRNLGAVALFYLTLWAVSLLFTFALMFVSILAFGLIGLGAYLALGADAVVVGVSLAAVGVLVGLLGTFVVLAVTAVFGNMAYTIAWRTIKTLPAEQPDPAPAPPGPATAYAAGPAPIPAPITTPQE